jgi:two-component system LytT family sensor kinase
MLLWIALFVLWVAVFQNNTLAFSRTVGIQFCYLVFIALNFYFSSFLTIPRFLNQKKYVLFTFTGLIFVIITSWMRAEFALFINTHFYHVPAKNIDFPVLYANSLLNIFAWTVVLIAGKVIADKIKQERYTEAIEKEKVVNELNFLRAQHNPHFLFNSLNSIYFQIDKTNPKAREMLMLLSEMLRYQLYDCTAERIAIDKEISYLENYITLQQFRFSENYKIDFRADSDVSNFMIAPLLVIPLIENAFKHVSHFSNKVNEINVRLYMKNGSLVSNISNTVERAPELPAAPAGGIGLKNLRRRLELLYPGKSELITDSNDPYYSATLTLKTDEN